ncbi:uracil-DNA glycosylase [Candidatus Fukatsuia anoeciicola]|uniref:uracil-DNA glycosylase n=1 Tax=Candidatus Fukatsuia anoeciicola TaxID=2994492 RepID=UPI003464DC9C
MSIALTWYDVISQEKQQPYFKNILSYIVEQLDTGKIIYPKQQNIFNAFHFTALIEVKVVIFGQDPYYRENQAHGLSFSVLPGIPIPPSLMNIYKELKTDILGFTYPNHGYLKNWAQQGILLLNTTLTVEAGKACSHINLGWEIFTNRVIDVLNIYREGIIFLLWGSHAQKKGQIINKKRHFILKAAHPSPLSAYRGFFGCKHFSKTNQLLQEYNLSPINW